MEIGEKIQQLRKEKEWTQEQLAEKLFVSRTAVSKWESGKGYPNMESLKSISKLFSVSIDDLLSGEELIDVAAGENRANINRLYNLVYGILDLVSLSFLFLPLYGRQDTDMIRIVSLFEGPDASPLTQTIYLAVPLLMGLMGAAQLAMPLFHRERWFRVGRTVSILLQALCILVYVETRQPYAASLLFLFMMIKVVLLIRCCRVQ